MCCELYLNVLQWNILCLHAASSNNDYSNREEPMQLGARGYQFESLVNAAALVEDNNNADAGAGHNGDQLYEIHLQDLIWYVLSIFA